MNNEFLFVIWSAARPFEQAIVSEIGKRFKVLRTFEVTWQRRHFTRNLAAFYGWKSWHVWRNKARRCGTGPFKVVVVEDPSPDWKPERDTSGHDLVVDSNIYELKKSFRMMTGRSNTVHSSVTPAETAHQLAALSSERQDPIPFRPMEYDDDVRIRAERRRELAGLIVDLLVPVSASVATGAIVWLDVFAFGTGCMENGVVEWSGLAISAACGALMTACAVATGFGRGAHALAAAFFFDMSLREADLLLDRITGSRIWPWALSVVTLTFAAVTMRYAKTVYEGLKAMRMSRGFQLFTSGAALMLLVSQCLGQCSIWQSLSMANAAGFSRFAEESVELFGYALMLAWAAPYAFKMIKQTKEASPTCRESHRASMLQGKTA